MSCLMHDLYAKPLRKPSIGGKITVGVRGHAVTVYRIGLRSFRVHYKGPTQWCDLWARDWREAWSNIISLLPREALFDATQSTDNTSS